MAMSYSRPDPASPAAIADASFGTSRRGFDQGEVRDFLRMVAAELARLHERERFLERELHSAQTNPDLDTVKLDDEALTRLVGEETARVLATARESAAEIREKAEQSASRLLSEAADEAARLREEAEIESSRRRADAAADAEAELEMAKQQGREMVNEARAYRERVLSELARRRELAREQIEQLIHGRDRLTQAFERARLVAVDVVSELRPLGEPDEYVDLSPTTGPVPVMRPGTPRPSADAHAAEAAAGVEDEADDPAADDTADAEQHDAAVSDVQPATAGDRQETTDADDVDDAEDAAAAESTENSSDADTDADDANAAESDTAEPGAGEPDAAETDTAQTDTDETAAGETDTGEPDTGDTAEGESKDVVVDLFARIRADAIDEQSDETVDAEEAADDADVDGNADAVADELEEDTPFARRDADLTPLIVSSAKKVKRVLADEQNEVLEALRRNDPVTDLGALLPAAKEHAARYADAIVDDLLLAAQAGAASLSTKKVARLPKAATRKSTTAATAVLDEWLVMPLRERLARCVADGDGDNDAITKRVRAVYREWKTQHIDEQLDDVLRRAHGRGLLAAIDTGTPVVWVADTEVAPCADCHDNVLAGAVEAGSEFPTGDVFAPGHTGCRCLIQPADR